MNTRKIAMLKMTNGTIHPTVTYDAFDTELISGVEADVKLRIGTSIGGTLISSSPNSWLPAAVAGLMRLW
jgi:hypothetical protein